MITTGQGLEQARIQPNNSKNWISIYEKFKINFGTKMILNGEVINNEVVELIKIYKFCFVHISIRLYLNDWKFEFQNMKTSNRILGS